MGGRSSRTISNCRTGKLQVELIKRTARLAFRVLSIENEVLITSFSVLGLTWEKGDRYRCGVSRQQAII